MRRRLPYAFEWAALAMLLAVLAFFSWRGLSIDPFTVTYTAKASLRVGIFALALGVALQALLHLRDRDRLRRYLEEVRQPAWLVDWLRLWLAIWVTSFAYFWLKVCIPFINPRSWDGAFSRLDELLHLGFAPTRFVPQLLGNGALAPWLDRWYDVWLLTLVVGIAFIAAVADRVLRRRVILSCVLLWTLGAWAYLAFPAVGPAFVASETWTPLPLQLPRATAAQAILWTNYQQVLTIRSGGSGPLDYRLGIAALPSLHVAFHVLFALWLWQVNRLAAGIVAGLALLTFVGSVLTGWHYAVDGYVGAALAWLCFWIAPRMEREATDPPPETQQR